MNNEKNTKNKGQGFSTHLLELRTRILRTLVILVFVFVLAFILVIVVSKLTYTKKEKNSNKDSGTQIQSGSYGIP